MVSYKKTLPLAVAVVLLLVFGMIAFAELEDMPYENGYSLCLQIMTTIGYGNVPPKTDGGKIFFLFYSTISIPCNLLLLQYLGEHMLEGQKMLITALERKLFKRDQPRYLNEKCSMLGVVILWTLILIGAGIVQRDDSYSYLDGVYFFQVTFSTVGFGDIIPQGKPGAALEEKILFPLYGYLGICAFSNVLNGLSGCIQTVLLVKRLFGCGNRVNREVELETVNNNVKDGAGHF